ncbi:LOW QUALITY PROTEIN: hypothetical protein DH2020_007019 [Rehmannia glutinosa]|uniref:Putative plant transposon protein domain-containing protein n=1 Tax=Rehmannia glutinosa TaxID=99300 RepID=A0ABR0TXU6_REHGL
MSYGHDEDSSPKFRLLLQMLRNPSLSAHCHHDIQSSSRTRTGEPCLEYAKPPSPVHAIVPGEEGNAINVEDTPDLTIIQDIHGPIGHPAGTPFLDAPNANEATLPSVFEKPSPTRGVVKKKEVVLSDEDEPDRENSPFDDDAPLAQVLVDIIANLGVKAGADTSKQTPAVETVEPTPPENDTDVSESASENVEESGGTPEPTSTRHDLSKSTRIFLLLMRDRYQVFKGRKFIEEKVCNHTYFERYNLNKFFIRWSLSVVINEFFGTPDCEEGHHIRDFNMVLKVLTGNRMPLWPAHPKKVSSSALTSLYGVLFKIALSNWVPSSHSSSVTREQATVIYLIGKGLPFNFGQLVFDQVLRHAESSSASGVLPFPSTIYLLLCSQGFDKLPNESFTMLPEMIYVSPKLMDRNKRVVDLPLYFSDDEPAAQADVHPNVIPDVMPSVSNI